MIPIATLDIFQESTQQEILNELRVQNALITILAKGYDIDSWNAAFEIGRSGSANRIMSVGDQQIGTYTINGTVYTCPWDVCGFRDVTAKVNGQDVLYKNAPIIQMHYCTHENQPFDAAETAVATEATAQDGFYYCGFDGTNYTMLTLSAGDTIPYESYTTVYKTLYNSVNAIRYGNSEWQYSWLRQYLNHSGTGWAEAQHPCDVLPNNAAAVNGFMTYIDADLANNVHPIKIATKQASYTGNKLIETYDKFFPLSISEMNMQNGNASADDGNPLDYYKALLESKTKVNTSTYTALIKYAVNNTTSPQGVRLRSATLGSYHVWNVNSSGIVSSNSPANGYRAAPACALV